MGEYVGRIFNESKCRPLYFVKKSSGEFSSKQIETELLYKKRSEYHD